MQTYQLIRHPQFAPAEVTGVGVRWAVLSDGRLMLRFRVDGAGALQVPAAKDRPARTDELWKSTCFELFLYDGGSRYREFNFSPSGDWAAYSFDGYRTGRCDFDPVSAPVVACDQGRTVFTTTAFIAAEELARSESASLSAVLVERDARPSYWALTHNTEAPDFHDPACFRIALRAPAGA